MVHVGDPRLTVELVPSTCWFSNVRSNVPRADWEACKRFVRERSGDACEICGGQGARWSVECHEIWTYDATTLTQRLDGLIALCPDCHEVKHLGRLFAVGGPEEAAPAIEHLRRVNGWSAETVEQYLELAFEIHALRSRVNWALDISYLTELGISVPPTLDRRAVTTE